SIYNLPLGLNSNYTSTLKVPDDSTSLYFQLSRPASHSWLAVRTGSEMNDFDAFLSILMPVERALEYSSLIADALLEGTGIANNTTTPWMLGLGLTGSIAAMLHSNSKVASIERHSKYSVFTFNMVHAPGESSGLPTSYSTVQGSSVEGEEAKRDNNWPSIIHALYLCGALILLFLFGAILFRHWVKQTISICLTFGGTVTSFYLSTQFAKFQSFGSMHQLLGIVILLAIITQWGVGFWHDRRYKKTQTRTMFGVVHLYFGFIVILLAIINGSIGPSWLCVSDGVVVGYSVACRHYCPRCNH
ncbi:hypothetical protein F1880_000463, partial [Penicillium rolfsii]